MKTESTRIILSGVNGQIGMALKEVLCEKENYELFAFDRHELDLTQSNQINEVVRNIKPHYFINTAAYTAVDKAESEAELCFQVNSEACGIIAENLRKYGGKLVHFSSDYVYHSYNGFPLTEDVPSNPVGVYAKSKFKGEQLIRETNIPALILRTSWVCSPSGKNFMNTILKLSDEKPFLRVVNDQFGAPSFAADLACEVMRIIDKNVTGRIHDDAFNDTYNYCCHGIITWYDLANEICKLENKNVEVIPIPSVEFATPATRPHWSVMSLNKIKARLKSNPPHWLEALKQCLTDRKNL